MNKHLQKCACAAVAVLAFGSSFFMSGRLSASAEIAEPEKRYSFTEQRYYDGISTYASDITSETVEYTRKEETYIETPNDVPFYNGHPDLSNSCGATGGAIVIGYYDKYYENLIPNYVSYYPATGKYKRMDQVYVTGVMEELYTLMRTNVDDVGVSESDCLNGLKAYVENRNYSINYTSIKSGSGFNETTYKNAINSGKPVLLFCSNVGISIIGEMTNRDSINTDPIPGNHIMVGYGYYQVKYYNGSTNFRTDTYMLAACGLYSYSSGYVKLSSTSWLDNGYAVNIS